VIILPEGKSPEKKASQREEKEIVPSEKKGVTKTKAGEKPTELAPYAPLMLWQDFDRVFNRFRRDFEDILWPWEGPIIPAFPRMPAIKAKGPEVDLEDRGKDFLLTAEMPGFKKEDVEIKVQDDSVEIRGESGWRHEDKTKKYVVKERGSESFYRMIRLPEEIKSDAVEASLKDGVMEIVLPKKTPKHWKKVAVK
jgi:HSP20 family protein